MASANHSAGSMPENLEPDRSRIIMSMLSDFANDCLDEIAPHPALAKELEVAKAENGTLTRENKILKADVKKLWQDNETLDRSLKQTAAERDHLKATTEKLQTILSQSKEPLHSLCLQLQQENDWVKRQHDALRTTTERLINDGLQLGVLVNTNTTNNAAALNIHYRHPTQAPHHVPVSSTHRVRSVQPPQNLPQQQSPTTQLTSHNAFAPSVHSQPQQKRVSVSRQTAPVPYPYQQSQSPVDNVRRQSAGPSHLSPQLPSQSQYIMHRFQQNHPGSVSPVEPHFISASFPGVPSHTDQSVFPNAIPHTAHEPCLASPNSMTTAQGLHHSNPYVAQPVQSQPWTQPQPSSYSPQPQMQSRRSSHSPQPQMQSRRSSHPLQLQIQPEPRSHSPFPPAPTQRSASSPHPLSQVQMPPQQQYAPFETQMRRHSVESQYAPEGLHLPSQVLQPIPNDLVSPVLAPLEYPQPPSTSDVQMAPAFAPSADTEKSFAGPAPPTPPRSIKSLSPEQEQYNGLPFVKAQPMKRGSIDMDYDAREEDLSSKRMRLEDGSGHDPHLSETVQEVPDMQSMEQNRSTSPTTAPVERISEGGAKVQDVQCNECTEQDVQSNECTEQDASNVTNHLINESRVIASKPPQTTVDQGKSDEESPGSGQLQADENEAEGESDDESEGNLEAEALEVVLKVDDSKKFCTLCRSRSEKVPDKYGDTYFDLDTPSWILVEHFSTTHSTAWNKLLGISDAT